MSHRQCDSKEDTGAASTLGWERLGHEPRSAHGKLVQPVPYTGGVPGDFYIRGLKRAPHAVALSFFAALGSLHCAFICALWK